MFRTAQTGFRLTLIKQRELTENCLLQLIFLSVQRTGGLTCSTGFIVSVETGASPKINTYNVKKKCRKSNSFQALLYNGQKTVPISQALLYFSKETILKSFCLEFLHYTSIFIFFKRSYHYLVRRTVC